jgi:hypothetical protein
MPFRSASSFKFFAQIATEPSASTVIALSSFATISWSSTTLVCSSASCCGTEACMSKTNFVVLDVAYLPMFGAVMGMDQEYSLAGHFRICTAAAFGQRPAFDVASLKPVELTPGNYSANLGTARNGEVILTNVTLSDCLRFAYTITNDAQIAGPDWIRNRNKDIRFDIRGKAAPDTPLPQLLAMLQTLLDEPFRLELRREMRSLAYLSMEPARNGPKLRPAVEGSDASRNHKWLNSIVSNRMAMPLLATLLSRFTR